MGLSRGMKRSARVVRVHRCQRATSSSSAAKSTEGVSLLECLADKGELTIRQRMKHFPSGVRGLYLDCLRYKNIRDASLTPLNAWTIDRQQKRPRPDLSESRFFKLVLTGQAHPSGTQVPRRQYEQQRRLEVDVSKMLPIVLIWIPPIIGYLAMVLAITAPRQLLSRHFLNQYEIYYYNILEYRQRQQHFDNVQRLFREQPGLADISTMTEPCGEVDEAGPILDPLQVYVEAFSSAQAPLSSVDKIPRSYMVQLALALGVHQSLPSWASEPVTRLALSFWLRFRIRQKIQTVRHDDVALLRQGGGIDLLTDIELMDACLWRGLPVDLSAERMRVCLKNHLDMIESVRNRLDIAYDDEGFGLFSVHLTILRFAWKT